MIEYLTDLGVGTWDPFWIPVLIWTVLALVTMAALKTVGKRHVRLHLDLRMALLAALPAGILIANVIPAAAPEMVYVVSLPAPQLAQASTMAQTAAVPAPAFNIYSAIGLLTLVVGLASFFGLARFAVACRSLRRLTRSAVQFHVSELTGLPDSERAELESGKVEVLVSRQAPVAFSTGVFRKRIVIPDDGSAEENLVIVHELVHHLNGDVWRAGVGQLVSSLFFFHPLVHVFNREARLLVELACDQDVLTESGARRSEYATLLLKYAGHTWLRTTPALAMADTRSHLYQRIKAMKHPITSSLGRRSVVTIAACLMGMVVFATACSESHLVEPTMETVVDENDEYGILARAMEKPANDEGVFVIVDDPPVLIGGLKGLQSSIQYPEIAERAGVQGRVFLQFLVQPDGSPSDIMVTRGIGAGCDEEAVRAVSDAQFVPGIQNGERVAVKMSLPITFKLNDDPPPPPVEAGSVVARTVTPN